MKRKNLDKELCEQGMLFDELETTIEQNGVEEVDGDNVIYGWFKDWRKAHDDLPPAA